MKPQIPIVDEQDNIISYKNREQLAPGDIYRVAALWIMNSVGDVLLAQRAFTKSHDPGRWGPAVAGTVEEGESYESNIVKEAEEELGLNDIEPVPGPKLRVRGQHNHFTQRFTLVVDKPASEFEIQKAEVDQVKWFSKQELERELNEHPEQYLKSLRDMIT